MILPLTDSNGGVPRSRYLFDNEKFASWDVSEKG